MNGDIHLDLLERVRVASPCPARWEDMTGDDRVRHCGQCNLKVHNLSAMTRAQAEALLRPLAEGATGRVCAQFYRRPDGTILTADCPVGIAAATRRAAARARRAASLALACCAGGLLLALDLALAGRVGLARYQPFAAIRARLNPLATPVQMSVIRGDVCILPRSPTPPTPATITAPPGSP